jgi:polygalacturonase
MRSYFVNDFGTVPDGKTPCTQSIQRAVDTAAAAGGGQVILRAGTYLTGSIFLKSHIVFFMEPGARLCAITEDAAYPEFSNRVAGVEMACV